MTRIEARDAVLQGLSVLIVGALDDCEGERTMPTSDADKSDWMIEVESRRVRELRLVRETFENIITYPREPTP